MKKIWLILRTIVSFPLTISLLLGAGSLRTKNCQADMEAELERQKTQDFVPVFRFAVASDTHVRSASDPRNAERFAELFRSAYRYSDAHESYTALDAVLVAGDVVNHGDDEEYDEFNRVVRENMRDGTQLITVMGNHEYGGGGHEGYVRNMNEPLDKHIVIKGFHIIGLSTDPKDTYHTFKQIAWMHEQLDEAKQDDPERPIFTMQHGHIWNTVYVSRSWFTQAFIPLHAVYAQYPQVVNFSGHSHGPVNHPFTVWQSGYTAVGCGTLNYFEMERDIGDQTVPDGSENAAQYHIVEVDAQNRVRILPYNILTNDFFKTPSAADDPDKQLIYLIEKPSDPSSYVYTAARKQTNGKPRFPEGAAVRAERVTDTTAQLRFDQAVDDVCVYGYRITVSPKDHPYRTAWKKEIYSEYYFEPTPQTLVCTAEGLKAGCAYTVKVVPLNAWKQTGKAITAEFSTVQPQQ